ncbi:NADH dehydrogenase [Sulfuriferula plumbiphila]|uniref:NADH dehydrogenase n=1 Tax=Sulfuriferula plumbiphila TaxID=171865 RepID=A0A512LCB2_9PROT|nr:proton-conducting transporter membrane subunit [Sulfuriferula plumbiphila]BBP04784.1 NADH dehydrogenase [Sulfuriferula plumbiphila]GEP32134.1 NADH dehydrogenase [Sulfuriferula plumbiphila]
MTAPSPHGLIGLLIALLWLTPALAIAGIALTRRPRWAEWLNLIAAGLVFAETLALLICSSTLTTPAILLGHALILSPLGAWVLLCVGTVYLLASIYATGYMRMLPEEAPRLPLFYALLAAFALSMLVAPLLNSPGLYWIAIDLTTIISAFLVGFERAPEPIEAAWKYIVIVSAGLSLALLGIVLFYWGGSFAAGMVYDLTWRKLAELAPGMAPPLAALAFLLVLAGFGTKVGLVPMHTWLPDAHSEGPAPVSAMLSGALLNTALLGIVRFMTAMDDSPVAPLAHTALILIGLLSLLVAALFIVRQTGIKRLMAYSSVEHMGVLAIGFGIGGPIGFAAAMYHMLNHSLTKSLMFFGAGNLMRAYETKDMAQMQGFLRHFPMMGLLFLAGAVAITGAPPFGLFRSEFEVVRAGLASGYVWEILFMALLLILIFAAFLNHIRRMAFGATGQIAPQPINRHLSCWQTLPMWLALIPTLLFGLWWPDAFTRFFHLARTMLP